MAGGRATAKLTRGDRCKDYKMSEERTKFCGLADVVAPTSAGSDRVKMRSEAKKNTSVLFSELLYFSLRAVCGAEGGTTDRSSRTEQRERP
jgi:hypothetical protein